MKNVNPLFLSSLLLAALLPACTTIPETYETVPTYAIRDAGNSPLAVRGAELAAEHPGESGFYPLFYGVDALGLRLKLAEQARSSIDIQYYYILPDVTGDLLLGVLLQAADRGVRVRLLLDGIRSNQYDDAFAVLDAHPNIDVRVSNPIIRRKSSMSKWFSNIQDLNHRMHNKSMTFDNTVTIVGGRNIGAEYFGANQSFNYMDLDVLAVGPVADEVSTEFDAYWNATQAVPVAAFIKVDNSKEADQKLRDSLAAAVLDAQGTPFADALKSLLGPLLAGDGRYLHWAPARVVFDLPYGETDVDGTAGPEVLAGELLSAIRNAKEEFFLLSPYFVPGDAGVEHLRQLRERGVRCVVITNSLASTDVPAVYGGYQQYQKQLLEIGVELWEVMAFPIERVAEPSSMSDRESLHAKTFAIDKKKVFVGSFNFDHRSWAINTEMGVLVDSPEMASSLINNVDTALPITSWRLRLSDKGKVEWVAGEGDREVVYTKPPQATLGKRFKAWFTSFGAIEAQL